MKKIIAVFLAIVMVALSVPMAFAEEQPQLSESDVETELRADNGMRTIFANLEEEQAAGGETGNGGYILSGLRFSEETATVTCHIAEPCKLVVAVYDEDSLRMLGSGTTVVEPEALTEELEDQTVELPVDIEAMPDYFLAKAFLLDPETNAALCGAYVCKDHTKAYEDFMNTTPDDFEDAEAVAFDDSWEDFGVFNDAVKTLPYDEAMTYSYVDGVYTFRKATKEVQSLKKGDLFYYQLSDEIGDFLLVRVKEIKKTKTEVAITEDEELALGDAFQFVRIDAEADFSEVELSQKDLGPALTLEDSEIPRSPRRVKVVDHDNSTQLSTTVGVSFPKSKEDDKNAWEAGFSIKGSIGYTLTASSRIYYDARVGKDFYEFKVELTHSVSFNVTVTGKIGLNQSACEIHIPDIPLGPAFLMISIYPILTFSGSLTVVNAELKIYNRVSVADTDGFTKENDVKCWQGDIDGGSVKLEFTVGLGIEAKYGYGWGKKDGKGLSAIDLGLSLSVEGGVKIPLTPSWVGVALDQLHDCDFCMSGSINAFLEITLSLKFKLISDKLSWKWDAIKLEFEWQLGNFYVSHRSTGWEGGSGECPHKYLAVLITVVDENGDPVEDAQVTSSTGICDANNDKKFEENAMATDASGQATLYFSEGEHTVLAQKDGVGSRVHTFRMATESKAYTLTLMDDDDYFDDTSYSEFNGHYYAVFPGGTVSTWEEAETYCEVLGGYLAVISSQAENMFLSDLVHSLGLQTAYFGYTDREAEDHWKWVKDVGSHYTNWSDGEPNNSGNEDYAEFYWKYLDGRWNDGNFGHGTQGDATAFICEWDSLAAIKKPQKLAPKKARSVVILTDEPSITIEDGAAVKTDAVPGADYILLVVKDAGAENILAPSNLLYIDQKTAETKTVSFPYVLREDFDNAAFLICGLSQSVTPGDVDGDGEITSADARLALRRSVSLEDYPEGSDAYLACDVNGDGKVGSDDARLILRASVGLEDPAAWRK